MKKYKLGYTTGVYDLFHVGHLNMLKSSKALCDKLIVGVTVDELVKYKGKAAVIPYENRALIVENIRYTDLVVPQREINKFKAWEKLKFDVLFVGDDWYNSPTWNEYEEKLSEKGVEIIYIPYTANVSTTELKKKIKEHLDEELDK